MTTVESSQQKNRNRDSFFSVSAKEILGEYGKNKKIIEALDKELE